MGHSLGGSQVLHFVKYHGLTKQNISKKNASQSRRNSNQSQRTSKKPRGAYILFGMDARPGIVAANPDMKVTQVMKAIGAAWAEVDDKEKARYHKMADEDKTRYEEETKAFLAAGGDPEALNRKSKKKN